MDNIASYWEHGQGRVSVSVAMTRSSSRLIGGASGAEMARRALQELISGTWLEQLQSLCTVYCVLYCVL